VVMTLWMEAGMGMRWWLMAISRALNVPTQKPGF